MARIVYTNKEIIITTLFIAICLFLVAIFPVASDFQRVISFLMFLVVIPVGYIRVVLKKPLAGFGVQMGNWKKGLSSLLLALAFSLPLVYIAIQYASFLEGYGIVRVISKSFLHFVIYSLLVVPFFSLTFEFFFRGLVLVSFGRKIGKWAILLQLAMFAVFLLVTGNFNLNFSYYLLAGAFSGWLMWKNQSLLWSTLYTWMFVILADTLAIIYFK